MLNYSDSWHDSDEIDSDLEQEAYSLLYYKNVESRNDENVDNSILTNNSNENLDNLILTNKSNENLENLENLNSSADNLDRSIVLSSSSHSAIENEIYSDTDSDDVKFIKKMTYSKPVDDLAICISSDENDFDFNDNSINTESSSVIQIVDSNKDSTTYTSSDEYDTSLNKENTSILTNVVYSNSPSGTNTFDHLFFDQKSTSSNWSVDIKPLTRSKFSSRYFETGSKSVCSICSKKGHSESDCNRSGPICILCGLEGHMSKQCDNVACCVCFRNDHQVKNCPFTPKFLRQCCKRCGQRGHSDKICPDIWRQYKYSTTIGAPVLKTYSSQNKSTVCCANCAKMGHFTELCPRGRMNSRFLGPPPIMEIIRFEEFDIYPQNQLSYDMESQQQVDEDTDKSFEEMPSFMEKLDVTTIIQDQVTIDNRDDCPMADESADFSQISIAGNSEFGHKFIMLSPIKNATPTVRREKPPRVSKGLPLIDCSTPRENPAAERSAKLFDINNPKIPTKLPGITTELLKKLFPEETQNYEKLPPALRKKLRKQLKNLIDHGYLPGDTNLTQERMEFWLQEISTGRNLSYRDKKKLLGSVSAALHSISDRVSINETIDLTSGDEVDIKHAVTKPTQSITESRKRRNKMSRQEKNLKNELKLSRKEKKKSRQIEKAIDDSIKARLRNVNQSVDSNENRRKNKFRKKQRFSAPFELP